MTAGRRGLRDAGPQGGGEPSPRRLKGVGIRAVLLISAVSLFEQWRLVAGRVPMPADVISRTPLFRGTADASRGGFPHAEMNDLATQFYPFRLFAGRALHSGELPLWNPHIMNGAPFLANIQSAVLYPPNLVLYGLLPAHVAWGLSFLVRPILAGVFTALLLRSLGTSSVGALAGAVAFAFSGFMVGWGGWPQSDAIVWLPLGLFAIDALSRRPTGRRAALTAVVLSLPFLAGHPEVAFFAWTAMTLFAGHRLLFTNRDRTSRLRFGAAFAVATVLAGGLMAVQILPSIEWVRSLDRFQHSLPHPTNLPIEDALSVVSRDAQADPNSLGLYSTGVTSYVGMLILAAVPLAALHRNRRDVAFFGVLAVGAFSVVYGVGPLFLLSQHLPQLNSVANAMAIGVLDLSVVVLAAFGITVIEGIGVRERVTDRTVRRFLLGSGIAIGAVVGTAAMYAAQNSDHGAAWFRTLAASAVLLAAGILVLVWSTLRRLRQPLFALLLLGIVIVDSATYAYGHVPYVQPEQIFPAVPILQELRARDPGIYRVAALDGAYPPNLEMVYGFESASGYDFPTADNARLLDPIGLAYISYYLTSDKLIASRDRRLDLMNVKYLFVAAHSDADRRLTARPDQFTPVLEGDGIRVFQNRTALPRAFLIDAQNVITAHDNTTAFAALADRNFDPSHDAIVDEVATANPQPSVPPGSVESIRDDDDVMTVQTQTSRPTILVLSESLYPGWRVTIDDHPATLLRVDATFQGARIPVGQHTIRFRFEADNVRLGAAISTVAGTVVLLLVLASTVSTLRRRHRPESRNTLRDNYIEMLRATSSVFGRRRRAARNRQCEAAEHEGRGHR